MNSDVLRVVEPPSITGAVEVEGPLEQPGEAGSSPPSMAIPEVHSGFTPELIRDLNLRFNTQSTEDILTWAWERFGTQAAVGTSFQGAGLVMLDLAKKSGMEFPVFTLDTGLLFPETLQLKDRLEQYFGFRIESLRPDLTVEEQARINGPELWKHNPDLCCMIRKVLPLRDKLLDLDCWITGLRREQSETRSGIGIVEMYTVDEESKRDVVKLNPMANWSRDAVWQYLREHRIPYNPLHDQGYRSIGCHTCTRKTGHGEGERAGRWTGFNKVECGIHTFMPKKVDFQI